MHIISGWIGLKQDFGRKKIVYLVSPLFIATNSTHFLYCCICFFPLQQLLFLQQTEHIFLNYLLSIFIITYLFQLLLLSISKVQISLVTFYFSPYVTGMLFQLVLNYLQVAGSWNTTFFHLTQVIGTPLFSNLTCFFPATLSLYFSFPLCACLFMN